MDFCCQFERSGGIDSSLVSSYLNRFVLSKSPDLTFYEESNILTPPCRLAATNNRVRAGKWGTTRWNSTSRGEGRDREVVKN
jgi:hypothetical protein